MNNIKKIILANCLILFTTAIFSSGTIAQELKFTVVKSQKDWLNAKEQAKSTGKDIFLDIYATWCGPCKMMDADVYTTAPVSEFFNSNYINLKVDGESEFGLVLAAQYSLSAYPSMYFINQDEQLINAVVGYRDSDALVTAGKQVKESGKRYLTLNTLYKSGTLSAPENDEYIDLLGKFGQTQLLAAIAGERIKSYTEADILNPVNKHILLSVGGELESFVVQTILKNITAIELSWGREDLIQFLSNTFDITMQNAVQSGDSVLMEKIADQLIPVYMSGNPDRIPDGRLTTRKIYYSQIQDWDNYIKTVEKHYDEFGFGNLRFLYQEAYYIVENQIFNPQILNKATEWLEKVIAIQPDFDGYFLAAIVNTYNEKLDQARIWMGKAESAATTEDEKDSLSELKKYLESL